MAVLSFSFNKDTYNSVIDLMEDIDLDNASLKIEYLKSFDDEDYYEDDEEFEDEYQDDYEDDEEEYEEDDRFEDIEESANQVDRSGWNIDISLSLIHI